MAQVAIGFGRVMEPPSIANPLLPHKAVKPPLNETSINAMMLAMSQQANSCQPFPVRHPIKATISVSS